MLSKVKYRSSYHLSSQTLEVDDGDDFVVILGQILVGNLEFILNTKNKDIESLHKKVLLLIWIDTESLVTHSKSLEPIEVPD